MKLIVEKYPSDGGIYSYRVSEKQFRQIKNKLQGERLDPIELDRDCSLDNRGAFHMIFDLKGR